MKLRCRTALFQSLGLLLMMVLSSQAIDSAKKHFWGEEWVPQPALAAFWQPITDNWWDKGTTLKLDRHCHRFAKQSDPRKIIPAMVAELKEYPSEIRPYVYVDIMKNWPKKIIAEVLRPFQRSTDPEIRKIADDLGAEFED